MTPRSWFITGVSSGFGRELTTRLLDRGDRVVGTLRRLDAVTDLAERHPDTFRAELLDVTDGKAVRNVVDRAFADLDRIDVVVSNAGYGLFGAAEELSDAQVDHIIATNLTGSIQLIRAALPHLRTQGGGRIIQLSTYGGQVAFAGNSLYHATKWGIEGFCEAVAQEVAPFGIGVTIVEPGARTEFRYGSAQVTDLMPAYDGTPAHSFLRMLDPANGLAPGDPARMAARIIDSADTEPAPLRMMLGSQALETTLAVLRGRIADFEAQAELAASTDFPPSEGENYYNGGGRRLEVGNTEVVARMALGCWDAPETRRSVRLDPRGNVAGGTPATYTTRYARSTGTAPPISSLAGSIETAVTRGLTPGRNFVTGSWQLGIDTRGNVIYHALYRP